MSLSPKRTTLPPNPFSDPPPPSPNPFSDPPPPPSPNPFANPSPTQTRSPKRFPIAPSHRDSDYRSPYSPKPIDLHPLINHPPPVRGYTSGGYVTALRQHIPGKRTWSTIRLCLRILSLLLSLSTCFTIAFVFHIFSRSRHQRYRDELLWPKNPQLSPTIYMLTASCVTIVVHIGLIISHSLDKEKYLTEAYTKRDKISTVVQVGLGLVWIVGAVLPRVYREERYGEGNELWSWSCKEEWHTLGGGLVGGDWVKWGTLCRLFGGAYWSAALNAVLEFLSVITFAMNTCMAIGKGYQAAPGH